LSPEDRRFIYTTLPKDRAAEVRVRLALGAEVPRNVELLTFPAEVATPRAGSGPTTCSTASPS
jgi:hypothetical protein